MTAINSQCAICQCQLYPDDITYITGHGLVDELCFRSLEILGRVWE